ncbi:chaperone protein clpb1 [Nicotiana attenuata]|uniref:Chaperone protein clpb1 n=1 Tax=Nicotiana attenuata TaxID=49451 RepID=A0A1J6KLA5_NICAT|nr:chaperone protein clpb1 [Nicotiana attenuata]
MTFNCASSNSENLRTVWCSGSEILLTIDCVNFVTIALQVYGARPIRRWLEKRVVTELSKMLVKEEIDENSTVYVDAALDGKDLSYRVEKNGGLVNAATGKKSDILIQLPNGPRSDAAQAVKKMKIEEIVDDDEMEDC